MAQRLFSSSNFIITIAAQDLVRREKVDLFALRERHFCGDWGDVDEHDRAENDLSVQKGYRILSSYKVGQNNETLWLITEADRSVTTVLLPEDY